MSDKIKAMQTPKRALIGGHMQTIFLTDYHIDNDTYDGEAHRNRKTGDEQTPVVTSVTGLRPYPYAERPDYSFQFVECGEDEQPLLDIADKNAEGHRDVIDAGKDDRIRQVTDDEPTLNPADTDEDGRISKKEMKQWNKDHPGETR